MQFKDIKIGARFNHRGTTYTKKTTRTAYFTKKTFAYFKQDEIISSKVKADDSY